MEVHRQTCQNCGSIVTNNIIVREPGSSQMIYVRCVDCKELVARYRLKDYYHHGKNTDSFLRSAGPANAESGRFILNEYERLKKECQAGLEKAIEQLEAEGKQL